MPIELTCSCGKQLRVADEYAGRQGQCPACGGLLDIPGRDALVSNAGTASLDAAQAVTTTPGQAAPEGAVTALPPEAAERMPAVLEVSRPPYQLFSPGAIGLVAFLSGPVGAFILLTLNYWRLGNRRAAAGTLGAGLFITGAVMVITIALPESFPAFLIGIPLFLGLWGAARALQGDIYNAHLRQGGESESGWTAAGAGLLGILLYLGVFLGLFAAYDSYFSASAGPKISYDGDEEIYYTQGATEADAQALGAVLREDGFFDGHGPKSVRIARDGDGIILSFVVQPKAFKDPQIQEAFRSIGGEVSQRAFGGRPVVVELCDEDFNVKKRL